MPSRRSRALERLRRWRPILPLLVAELVVLIGFGALLPVLPIYVVNKGIDTTTLGVILAAWPGARLVAEPVFGWLADRVPRKPLLYLGLGALAVVSVLPLWFDSPLQLLVLRLLAGTAAAMYDPAARGTIVDATRDDERGEAFGLYTSAQMGGLLIGPVVGAAGAALGGGLGFPFVAAGVACLAALAYLAFALRGRTLRAALPPPSGRHPSVPLAEASYAELGTDSPDLAGRFARDVARDDRPGVVREPFGRFLNRFFAAATVMNFGLYCSVGVYEVVWSLYLEHLGAGLAWIGVTFMLFGTPVLLLAPFAGRLIDRYGGIRFAVAGGLGVALAGFLYALATDPYLPGLVIVGEGVANAFVGPALFALLAQGTPSGRSATAQGLFGASGTVAFVIASLLAGGLYTEDPRLPFVFMAVACAAAVLIGGLVAGRRPAAVAVGGAA